MHSARQIVLTTKHQLVVPAFLHTEGAGGFTGNIVHLKCKSLRLLGRVISLSQGRYLHTKQHKHIINVNNIHALSGIRTHDPSVRAAEDSSCLRPRDHSDRQLCLLPYEISFDIFTRQCHDLRPSLI
jgi:hypothetical protein